MPHSRPLDPSEDGKPTRIIDMKIPLPWLIAVAAAIVSAFVSVTFSVDRMREDMTELKVTHKALLAQFSSVAGDVALLKFRVETLEADKRAIGRGSK